MDKSQRLVNTVSRKLNLPAEILSGDPMVEIKGRQETVILHHRGIVEYTTERIQVGSAMGLICVSGTGLGITLMNSERIVISGTVAQVSFVEERT